MKRRDFLKISATAGMGAVAGCSMSSVAPEVTLEAATITPRPRPFSGTSPRGLHRFGIWSRNDAFLYVPPTYREDKPAPFLMLLHGASGSAANFESSLSSRMDAKGIVVLAFNSSLPTWDRFSLGGFGPDIERMNLALDYAFGLVNVDPAHVALGGFSDGASYALTTGVANGDLFTAIIAYSPGQLYPPGFRGKPPVFISHGTGDSIIPITYSRDSIAPQLGAYGHTVTFREFTGGHQVPSEVAHESLAWFVSL